MSRLKDAIDLLLELRAEDIPVYYKPVITKIINTLINDVQEERHGHWILTNKPNIYGGTSIKCSECGYEGVIAHIEDHHYCWVCGASMDLVDQETEE